MRIPILAFLIASLAFTSGSSCQAQSVPSAKQLENWRKRFPDADADRDGTLTIEEASRYREKLRSGATDRRGGKSRQGAPRQFTVSPGWGRERFPEHAVCYLPPQDIKAVFQQTIGGKQPAVVSYEKPDDGALRIVGTGHSFMAPGYRTFPVICKAAGMDQPLYTHTGGGITGSTRYKWEQENGIFDFEGRPQPKLLASIANAKWDAMMWGPYFNDRPVYYSCWIDFCLKYNPHMKFYLSDAWPQLYQLGTNPESESFFTAEIFDRLGAERRAEYVQQVEVLRKQYPDKVFIMPTSDAMVLAAKSYLKGELPGVEGIHRVIGGKERSLWRDQLGHIGPGFDRLEGYVFYATLYGRSPELIEDQIAFGGDDAFPGPKLDRKFREIAWQAVIGHPLSGVEDRDGDRVDDSRGR
ncbi:hypothetical protein [Stieleria mannarensis]|uniref:hypothetical protein n=1 Tax=Stieleria mannarensis TaxID=2755585 RepID=UPI001602B4DA|nr:hypothetical protein [Rhodopirellula sp. JC639]